MLHIFMNRNCASFIVVMERNYSGGHPGEKQPMSAVDFAEMADVEYSVDEYFEPEELAKMSPIEKRRYKNLRANYEVMKAMGEFFPLE